MIESIFSAKRIDIYHDNPVHGSDNDPWTNDTHTNDCLVSLRLTFSPRSPRIVQVIQAFS